MKIIGANNIYIYIIEMSKNIKQEFIEWILI